MASILAPVPEIHTYHCLCTSLLFATTHSISSLPRRQGSAQDHAVILPLPAAPPRPSILSSSRSPSPKEDGVDDTVMRDREAAETVKELEAKTKYDLPPEGYTVLLSMTQDRKPVIIRKEDGFERRLLWRCGRCRLVVAYDVLGAAGDSNELDANEEESGSLKGKGKADQKLKVIYLLPAGILSTDAMVSKERKIKEETVDIVGKLAIAAFE